MRKILDKNTSRRASAITEFRINDLSYIASRSYALHLELVVFLEASFKSHGISTCLALSHVDYECWFVHLEIRSRPGVTREMFLEASCHNIGHSSVVGPICCFNDIDEIHWTPEESLLRKIKAFAVHFTVLWERKDLQDCDKSRV